MWDAECQVRAVGGARLTQAALDFLKGCGTATIRDTDSDLLSVTRHWLELRFHPAGAWQPQVGWGCGYLMVDFQLDRGAADVVISARQHTTDYAAAALIPDGCREH